MTYTPEDDEQEPAKAESILRSVIAGAENGSVRRILLYILLATLVGLASAVPQLAFVAMPVILLLALTDRLV